MPPIPSLLADPLLRERLSTGLEAPSSPEAVRLAHFVAQAFGNGTVALVHYGSRAQGSAAAPESAYDYFVILDAYEPAYRALVAALRSRFAPGTAAWLNRLMPPNVLAIGTGEGPERLEAKCAVLTLRDLERACSRRARDLWVLARLFQPVHLVWARDEVGREAVHRCVAAARALTFEWGRPFLPPRFDADQYCRALLATAYGAEVRPEGAERIEALLRVQRPVAGPVYQALLAALERRGEVAPEAGAYRDRRPPDLPRRLAVRAFLALSKARATLRWIKYVALYDDWLEYVVHKMERRGGVAIELTPRERRWPLIFLWPKALRALGAARRRAPLS